MTELIIRSGKHQGKKLVLPDGQVVIGRDESCQIRLEASDVSRYHCSLRPSPDGLVARDLGSHNGTFLNDVRIEQEAVLQPGDSLQVGPIVFEIPPEAQSGRKDKARSPTKGLSKGFTEDDIVGWLSNDQMDGDDTETGETTILRQKKKEKRTASPSKELPRKEFQSVAEEAADIIRRHWEMVKHQEQEQ